eukprot:COSAG02_NODE_6276_length_3686_cov_2.296627_7_plen_40_part_01
MPGDKHNRLPLGRRFLSFGSMCEAGKYADNILAVSCLLQT